MRKSFWDRTSERTENMARRLALFLIVVALVLNSMVCFAKAEDDEFLPVLLYHNVRDDYVPGNEGADISTELFEEHMKAIIARGYTPILIKDFYDCVIRGKDLPENPIAVTFDDGYLSNYEIAYPILKKLNIPATIFIVTSTVGLTPESGLVSEPHFSWEQAREMQESGMIDIYSHSHSHRNMSYLTIPQLQTELRLSRYLIEKNLGKNCFVFAYPYGGYSESTSRMAKYAGYRMQILVHDAKSSAEYLANRVSDGIETFTRITVHGDMSVDDVYSAIDSSIENTKIRGK